MGLKIFGNLDRNTTLQGLVVSASTLAPKPAPDMFAGDSVSVDVFLTSDDGLQNIQAYPNIRLGIGGVNSRPTSGSYTITIGATTETLAYNADNETIETAIESVTSTTCEVTQLSAFVFKCVFDSNGARTLPTVDPSGLDPSSSVNFARLVTGDGSTREEWIIRIFQNPLALTTSWTNIDGNGVRGVLNLGTAGIYDLFNGTTEAIVTNLELEITNSSGDVQTIFQVPINLRGEVIGDGASGVANWDNYLTSADLTGVTRLDKHIFVSASQGSDSTGAKEQTDKPFATITAALAVASQGDILVIRDGTFSGNIGVTTGMAIQLSSIASGPNFAISNTSGTVTIMGGEADAVTISTGTVHASHMDLGYVYISGGTLSIEDSTINQTPTGAFSVITDSGNISIRRCVINNTSSNPCMRFDALEGKVMIADTLLKSTSLTGIVFSGTPSTSAYVQLKDVAIITPTSASQKAIDATSGTTATVQVQGSLSTNMPISSSVTLDGGIHFENINYNSHL